MIPTTASFQLRFWCFLKIFDISTANRCTKPKAIIIILCVQSSSDHEAKCIFFWLIMNIERNFLDKGLEAPCSAKTLEKTGIEPTAWAFPGFSEWQVIFLILLLCFDGFILFCMLVHSTYQLHRSVYLDDPHSATTQTWEPRLNLGQASCVLFCENPPTRCCHAAVHHLSIW